MKNTKTGQRRPEPPGIGYKVRLLSQLISRRVQADLIPHGLTPFHWFVLRCLWAEDGLPVSTIGERLQEVGGTMTGVLDRMEERGLIKRVRDEEDRRVWRIFLTDKGVELEETLPPLIVKVRKRLVKGVSASDLQTFNEVLDHLIDNAHDLVAEIT